MPDSEAFPDGLSRKKLILVADNEPHIADRVGGILERVGYATVVVYDGQQAIDYLDTAPPPDLVVVDAIMPRKDGFQVVDHLKQSERLLNVPYLFMSAKASDPAYYDWLRDSGEGDHFIEKPFQPEELLAKVRHLIG